MFLKSRYREPLSLSWAGSEFHTVGAATEKSRLSSSVRVSWVCSRRVSTDRDEREDVTGRSRSDRYDGVEDARILYVWALNWDGQLRPYFLLLTKLTHKFILREGRISWRPSPPQILLYLSTIFSYSLQLNEWQHHVKARIYLRIRAFHELTTVTFAFS